MRIPGVAVAREGSALRGERLALSRLFFTKSWLGLADPAQWRTAERLGGEFDFEQLRLHPV